MIESARDLLNEKGEESENDGKVGVLERERDADDTKESVLLFSYV